MPEPWRLQLADSLCAARPSRLIAFMCSELVFFSPQGLACPLFGTAAALPRTQGLSPLDRQQLRGTRHSEELLTTTSVVVFFGATETWHKCSWARKSAGRIRH